MNINELKEVLTSKGITFPKSASKAELEALLNSASSSNSNAPLSEDLQKKLEEMKGFSFDSDDFRKKIKEQKEREYPDYGKDVPENVYTFTGRGTIREWRNPTTERVVNIVTAYLADDNENIFEVAAAAFCKREWDFLIRENSEYKKLEFSPILPFYSSIADRNEAVGNIEVGTKVKVNHARGHFDNPLRGANARLFDFVYTWVEKA